MNNADNYNSSHSVIYEDQEELESRNTTYSCCISLLSFICGYFLLTTQAAISNKPKPQYRHLHFRECSLTLPFAYMCALGFFFVFMIRVMHIFVFCTFPSKTRVFQEIIHQKFKRVEIIAGLAFFFIGSFLLMLKEDCYDLNVALLFALIITSFMILQICCYDLDPDEVFYEDVLDY